MQPTLVATPTTKAKCLSVTDAAIAFNQPKHPFYRIKGSLATFHEFSYGDMHYLFGVDGVGCLTGDLKIMDMADYAEFSGGLYL